mmetsp:Transcript_87967/g.272438  ORF Transcript_87967/g.272438 Transcript_87967/m.272438 type:complete len:204 (-) Transcript_87967:81-692(-)
MLGPVLALGPLPQRTLAELVKLNVLLDGSWSRCLPATIQKGPREKAVVGVHVNRLPQLVPPLVLPPLLRCQPCALKHVEAGVAPVDGTPLRGRGSLGADPGGLAARPPRRGGRGEDWCLSRCNLDHLCILLLLCLVPRLNDHSRPLIVNGLLPSSGRAGDKAAPAMLTDRQSGKGANIAEERGHARRTARPAAAAVAPAPGHF